jgi:hypothetical protein
MNILAVCVLLLGLFFNVDINNVHASYVTFSIFHISDTQFLAQSDKKAYFDTLTTWIVNNYVTYNCKMVTHTGDIVNRNYTTQWDNANSSMSTLLNNNIPYVWCAGNHDLNPLFIANSPWLGKNYKCFNASYMASKPYWVSSAYQGKNTAAKFTVSTSFGNLNFLVISLEYDANSSAVTWATNLLITYNNSYAIVCTHDYMNVDGTYTAYGTTLKAILTPYKNVIMVLCGHKHDALGLAGSKIYSYRADLQFDLQEYDSLLGAADVQIIQITVSGLRLFQCQTSAYQTYSPTGFLSQSWFNLNFVLRLRRAYKPRAQLQLLYCIK